MNALNALPFGGTLRTRYLLLNTAFSLSLLAQDQSYYIDDYPSQVVTARHLEGSGIGFGKGYTTLEGFFTVPLVKDWIVPFLDLRGHAFNDGKLAANAGIGGRFLLNSRCQAVGVNAYYDYRDTHHGHFHQIGAGFEYLSPRWEARANGYFPVSVKIGPAYGPAFDHFSGHFMFVHNNRRFALTGGDAEFGWHFRPRDWIDLYIGAGPYYFKGDFRNGAAGGKARVKLQLTQYCYLQGVESYDSLFHNRASGEIAVSFPFGPKKQIGRCCEPCLPQRMYQERIYTPPYRDEIIVTEVAKKKGPAIDPSTGDPLFFVFVDNTSSSNGTFESPFPTLLQAQNASAPGNIIYVFAGDGTTTGMDQGITLQDRQRFLGSGTTHSFPTTIGDLTVPKLTANTPSITSSGSTVLLGANNEVSGFNITNAVRAVSPNGIYSINRNSINTPLGNGIEIFPMNSNMSLTVKQNQIVADLGQALEIIDMGTTSSTTIQIQMSKNHFISSSGICCFFDFVPSGGDISIQGDISSNTFTSDEGGIFYQASGTSTFDLSISHNSFQGQIAALGAVTFVASGDTRANNVNQAIIFKNSIEQAVSSPPIHLGLSSNQSLTNFVFNNNEIKSSINQALLIENGGGGQFAPLNLEIIGNSLTHTAQVVGSGSIVISATGNALIEGSVNRNSILNTGSGASTSSGIFVSNEGAITNLQIDSNQIQTADQNGINILLGGITSNISVTNNVVQNTGVAGPVPALIVSAPAGNDCFFLSNNQFFGNNSNASLGDVGITVSGATPFCLTMTNNSAPQFGYVLTQMSGTFNCADVTTNIGPVTTSGTVQAVSSCTNCP